MAEEIVACPSCGKKFRIPEGAPPGSFKCTACEADVTYGASGAAPAGGGAKRGGRAKAGAGAKAGRKSRGARRAKARAARESEGGSSADRRAARERKQTEKGANTGAIVASVMGGIAVIVLLILALKPKDETPEPDPGDGDTAADTSSGLSTNDGARGTGDGTDSADGTGAETPAGGTGGAAGTGTDETGEEEEDSGIGASGRRPSGSKIFTMDKEKLFVDYPFLDETPPEERQAIQSSVNALVDRNSGRKGVQAQNDLEKIGKPAIPALISTWKGRTWDNEDDQLATDIVQRVLRKIVKDDGPTSDFHARFVPHEPIDAAKFERAGRMWISWWLSKGIDIEKFSYADGE